MRRHIWTSDRLATSLCLSVLLTVSAQAQFLTYAQWASETASMRAAYIAGAFDSVILIGNGEADAKTASHYSQCVLRSKMKNDQLAEGVLRFAQNRPALHAGSVQAAMLQYLVAVCGAPPPR
jgi:hypothetical protein